ncbi:hypothetical protein NC651_011436 [Populus alba x Populus x berolinensis]|nr:hypothetical protein NC651_011436 [Populus alba x Populus x berolinensis]
MAVEFQQHSFYDLIINKARGKSGPLFHFDVHEDVRTIADATIEKDEAPMPVKLLRGTGMKRINTSFLLQDGRYMTRHRSGSVTPSMGIDRIAKHGCCNFSKVSP